MKAADTSAVVAAFASWHEHHDAARKALVGDLRLVEHCALETYSVLTRLPPPHRSPATVVRDFIAARFSGPWLRLTPRLHRSFLAELPERGITGGATYDALVAATAIANRAALVTCDRRALAVYEAYGLKVLVL